MPLTPEQQALREAAIDANGNEWKRRMSRFDALANPAAILALLAQLEAQEAPSVHVFARTKEAALQALADQAQELGMGYGDGDAELEEWRRLKDPSVLHASLLRGLPARLTPDQLRHIAGDFADGAALSQPVHPDTDKLLSIIASAYQIAGAHDAPAHILDVLADPEAATVEQVEAMLPYQAGAVPAVLFDGMAVYEEVRRKAGRMRTSPDNVSDVLDAVVRLIRAAPAGPDERKG